MVQGGERDWTYVTCGVIRTPADMSFPGRLDAIYRSARELMSQHTPNQVVVEELFFSKNVKTAFDVGQARGVLMLALRHFRDDTGSPDPGLTEYNPSQAKKILTGAGNADKRAMQKIVQQELDLNEAPEPDDAADALALALCHLIQRRFPSPGELS